jgi:hypothetical protein
MTKPTHYTVEHFEQMTPCVVYGITNNTAEQEVLKLFGKNYITKDILPDGHKETINPIHKQDLLEFLNTL